MKHKISAFIAAALIILFSLSSFAEGDMVNSNSNINYELSSKSELSENGAIDTEPSDEDNSDEANKDDKDNKDNKDNDNLPNDENPEDGEPNEGGEPAEEIKDYAYFADSTEFASDFFNVQSYTVLEEEKYNMYEAEQIMRRDNAIGEAWAVFEIPYVSEFYASSCHLPSDAVPMSFELSRDGVSWNEADVTITVTVDENRWTKIDYSAENISGIRYIKVIWGEEANLQNWWNPYFLGLYANSEEPQETEIVIDGEDELYIPIYEPCEYTLCARVLDQIGNDMAADIIWSCNSEIAEVSSDGKVVISPDMPVGEKFTVRAESGDLFAEKTFELCAAMPADTDGDNIITYTDIERIIENYAKTAEISNRLCDADKNGVIDIIDLAYAARYMTSED